jgi:hypothetical protein
MSGTLRPRCARRVPTHRAQLLARAAAAPPTAAESNSPTRGGFGEPDVHACAVLRWGGGEGFIGRSGHRQGCVAAPANVGTPTSRTTRFATSIQTVVCCNSASAPRARRVADAQDSTTYRYQRSAAVGGRGEASLHRQQRHHQHHGHERSRVRGKFGNMGRATNYLVSNRASTFTINTGRTEGGANFVARDGGGGDINVDVAAFKGGKMLGGVSVSATEALVHEMAHGVSTLIQGHSAAMNSAWGTSLLTKASPRNEAYATVIENAWRRATMDLGIPIIDGYFAPGDVRDPPSPSFFP